MGSEIAQKRQGQIEVWGAQLADFRAFDLGVVLKARRGIEIDGQACDGEARMAVLAAN